MNLDKAMQGWLAADPPPPPRAYIPGEEHKWRKMMGAAHLLPPSPSPVTCEEIERQSRELHAKVIRCQAKAAER